MSFHRCVQQIIIFFICCINQLFSLCNGWGKKEGTHVVNEDRGLFGSLEERCVGGVLEVASVLLKGRFVQSLLPTNENSIRNIKGDFIHYNKNHTFHLNLVLCKLSRIPLYEITQKDIFTILTSLYSALFLSACTSSGVSHTKQPIPFSQSRSSLYLTYRGMQRGILFKHYRTAQEKALIARAGEYVRLLTLLTLSLTILLKKNSGRSGMDFHVPRELMYFSLYLT